MLNHVLRTTPPSSSCFSSSSCFFLPLLVLWTSGAAAAEPSPASPAPEYPRTNISTWYKVDPDWPERPSYCQWGDVPGVAVDAKDRVWVYTRAKPPVQVYDATGKFLFAWGDDTVGRAHHIKIGAGGEVWLADIGHHVIRKYSEDGKVLLTLGTPDAAGCDATHLNRPTDMAITPSGDIFVSDGYGNNRVAHFDAGGKFVKEWGKLGTAPGDFSLPHAIALDSKGRIYIADRNNARVQIFSQDGKLSAEWRNLIVPWGFWVTKADEIWVCGSSPMFWRETDSNLGCPPKDQAFMRFNPDGKLLQIWTVPKGTDGKEQPGELNWVHGMAVDSLGNIYAGDIVGKRAQKFLVGK